MMLKIEFLIYKAWYMFANVWKAFSKLLNEFLNKITEKSKIPKILELVKLSPSLFGKPPRRNNSNKLFHLRVDMFSS